MSYQTPNRKKYSDLKSQAEREYFEMSALREAEKLLERIGGSDDFKALVGNNLGKMALERIKPRQVHTQGPSAEFKDFMDGGRE